MNNARVPEPDVIDVEQRVLLAAFIYQGGERSGRQEEMLNVGLHKRASPPPR